MGTVLDTCKGIIGVKAVVDEAVLAPEPRGELELDGSSGGSSLSDFKTRSPCAEAQRLREASSWRGVNWGTGPLRLDFREEVEVSPEGGETRGGSARNERVLNAEGDDFALGETKEKTTSTAALSSATRWLPSCSRPRAKNSRASLVVQITLYEMSRDEMD
jgi:hypothetical protein